MATKNVWSEYQESCKKIVQNNSEFLKQSGDRIKNAVSSSNNLVSNIVSEMGSAINSEGCCSTMSQQTQAAYPVVQNMVAVAQEGIDTALSIAESATLAAEKNVLEVGKVTNSALDEQSQQMVPPSGDVCRASAKHALSSWVEMSNWILQASRNGISAFRSVMAAQVPANVPATVNAGRANKK
ncbi:MULTISPECIES: hypothetical protein [Candidatus Ichthyocystis]|uniref:hypothetical protein n=1 Tax=Candidatus Ichthyocystis TaxID=2929841 RepID=UPI000B88AE50|nr:MULTISPECIES: hypothetical protein [Ichthyocystis]